MTAGTPVLHFSVLSDPVETVRRFPLSACLFSVPLYTEKTGWHRFCRRFPGQRIERGKRSVTGVLVQVPSARYALPEVQREYQQERQERKQRKERRSL